MPDEVIIANPLTKGGSRIIADRETVSIWWADLDKYETTVVPGKFFGASNHFRIGIGGETEIVRGGLDRLSAVLNEFRKR